MVLALVPGAAADNTNDTAQKWLDFYKSHGLDERADALEAVMDSPQQHVESTFTVDLTQPFRVTMDWSAGTMVAEAVEDVNARAGPGPQNAGCVLLKPTDFFNLPWATSPIGVNSGSAGVFGLSVNTCTQQTFDWGLQSTTLVCTLNIAAGAFSSCSTDAFNEGDGFFDFTIAVVSCSPRDGGVIVHDWATGATTGTINCDATVFGFGDTPPNEFDNWDSICDGFGSALSVGGAAACLHDSR